MICTSIYFFKSKDFNLESAVLKHKVPCVGFSFVENDRRRIKLSAVKKIGIPEGPLLGKLQDGKTISFKGKKVSPKNTTFIVEGRKVTFITDTLLVANCYKLSKNADLLIASTTVSLE